MPKNISVVCVCMYQIGYLWTWSKIKSGAKGSEFVIKTYYSLEMLTATKFKNYCTFCVIQRIPNRFEIVRHTKLLKRRQTISKETPFTPSYVSLLFQFFTRKSNSCHVSVNEMVEETLLHTLSTIDYDRHALKRFTASSL